MRYRSATVADFHGIPRVLKREKELRTRAKIRVHNACSATPLYRRFLATYAHPLLGPVPRASRRQKPKSEHRKGLQKNRKTRLAKHISSYPDMMILI